MELELLKALAGNGVVAIVLAIALFQLFKLQNKLVDVIERNSAAMQKLADNVEAINKCK